jgi:hypothetical protein
MAAFGFSSSRVNTTIGGFSSWKVTRAGDTGYVSLGDLADGRLVTSLVTAKNSNAQLKPYGVRLEASAKMLGTDKTTVLQLLDHLTDAQLTHKITCINTTTFKGDWGMKWRFDSSSDYGGYRYVEVTADHSFLIDHASLQDWTELINTPDVDGSLSGELATFAATTKFPAGMTSFTIRNTGETNWEAPGLYRSGKLVVETLTYQDPQNRSVVYGAHYAMEAELMQTSATELALLDNVANGTPDFKAILADGTIFTLADITGVTWEYHNDTDADGTPFVRIAAEGVGTPAAVVALFT